MIVSRRLPFQSINLSLGPTFEEIPLISAFLDGWLQPLTNAGLRTATRFNFDAFWESNEARMAVDTLLKPQSEARFEFQTLEIEYSLPPEGLHFNSTSLVDTSLTFSAKVFFNMTDDPEWRYRSTGFKALDV